MSHDRDDSSSLTSGAISFEIVPYDEDESSNSGTDHHRHHGDGGSSSGSGSDARDHSADYDEDEDVYDDEEDEDAVMSSQSLPVVKECMRRIMRMAKVVRQLRDEIMQQQRIRDGSEEGQPSAPPRADGGEGDGRQEFADRMRACLAHYHYLWCRLLRLLRDEHDRCTDTYAQSLNLQDRVPFESLAHGIHHNTHFCDLLGEVVDVSVASYEEEHRDELTAAGKALLREYTHLAGRTQYVATYCALMVVEGTRESYLDPIAMHDLCKTVVSEPVRRKRIVPLSLMFSVLDQDDQAVGEAMSQNVAKVLLQRLRHLVHRLFGRPHEEATSRAGPAAGAAVSETLGSQNSSYRVSPRHSPSSQCASRQSPSRSYEATSQSRPVQLIASPPSLPDSPLPSQPAREGERRAGTFPALLPDALTATQEGGKRGRSHGEASQARKARRVERGDDDARAAAASENEAATQLDAWTPALGDKVGRGPSWSFADQAAECDQGEVVGITEDKAVIVRWLTSPDGAGRDAAATSSSQRLFRYTYSGPRVEVVRWEAFVRTRTMEVRKEDFHLLELQLICAVVGVLCQQRDTILPALQFQTLDAVLHVFDTLDLAAAQQAVEHASEAAEMREKERLSDPAGQAIVDEALLQSYVQWDVHLHRLRTVFRDQRELLARVGWLLNALLMHRKLALLFIELDGVRRVLKLMDGAHEVGSIYGCCIVLSHLAKTAIFEELLRRHDEYFRPILDFVLRQWQSSPSMDVQSSAGAFLFHAMSFPRVLAYFDQADGAQQMVTALKTHIQLSEEHFDVQQPGVQLATLRCLNIYLIAHLMLSTKVLFRRHRVLSALVTRSQPNTSLPRDPATVDAVLSFLSAPAPTLPDVSVENVQSLLTPDRLTAIQRLTELDLPYLLLRGAGFYFVQSRWELLTAALQALCVLTVVPHIRPLLAVPRAHDTGIAQMLLIINELTSAHNANNSSREAHLLPCVIAALQILVNVTTLPADADDDTAFATFNNICGAIRASGGVRALLEVLKLRKDEASLSAKLSYFPVVARAVQLMVVLRRYGDTAQLFEALGVHRIAQDLLLQYNTVQREYISLLGARKLHTELDPAGRFMENVKSLRPGAFGSDAGGNGGGSGGGEAVKDHSSDPLEMEQRQAIISRAAIDYSKRSLLELIARHLDQEGFAPIARALRSEARLGHDDATGGLADGGAAPAEAVAKASSAAGSFSLDGLVRSYLRQQQEQCPNPIETLPQFDLTKSHVYLPAATALDGTRNAFNRALARRMGAKFTLRMAANESCLTYRYPAFTFDITGGGEDLQAESVAFCDDGDSIMIGTSEGAVAVFDTFPEESSDEKLLEQHLVFENEGIASLVVSPDGRLVAAVNEWDKVKVMSRQAMPVVRQEFTECHTVRFSHDGRHLLSTSQQEHTCRLFDLATGTQLQSFNDRVWSGENMYNVAVFDATSQLVLNDAILWDARCGDKPIFCFDRIADSFASTFHPNNQLVIIDEKVWDLRSSRLVHTIPSFQKASSFHFSRVGRAIYSFREAVAGSNLGSPIVSAVESSGFELIFSEEVRPAFKCFAVDPSDRYSAAILDQDAESVIRVFTTSSGPVVGHTAFAAPGAPEEQEGSAEDNDEEDEEDDEDWSDESGYYDYDDDYDDDDDDDEEEEDEDDDGESTLSLSSESGARHHAAAHSLSTPSGTDDEDDEESDDDEEEEDGEAEVALVESHSETDDAHSSHST